MSARPLDCGQARYLQLTVVFQNFTQVLVFLRMAMVQTKMRNLITCLVLRKVVTLGMGRKSSVDGGNLMGMW